MSCEVFEIVISVSKPDTLAAHGNKSVVGEDDDRGAVRISPFCVETSLPAHRNDWVMQSSRIFFVMSLVMVFTPTQRLSARSNGYKQLK